MRPVYIIDGARTPFLKARSGLGPFTPVVCVGALREGVVDDADIADGAMIFGAGFAPFRGGPLHYAKTRGVDNVVSTLRDLSQKYGKRFAPDPGWDQLKKRA
jgi:3-hydroxyacyl-CoA dehydrogenase/enoyl-CoA hydratase/3-hydroxybutyryl-CoA epimerase